ncbi:hypothetical protein EBZ38_04760 [bacterium]|nr:hypothetical protein [bacterium]
MSRDFNKICQSIYAANDKIYAGEQHVINELQSIKNDLRIISKKLDKVLDMVIRIIKESN